MNERRPNATESPRDPGAYIGRKPERANDATPAASGPNDRRAPGTMRQGPVPRPGGHRDGPPATDAVQREAGQDR